MISLRNVVIALIAAGVTALVLVAINTANKPSSPATPTTTTTIEKAPASSDTTAVAGVKPPIRGLVDQFDDASLVSGNPLHSFVVSAAWAELQPTAGGAIAHPNVIDHAIAAVRSLDDHTPATHLKLRVFAGVQAP